MLRAHRCVLNRRIVRMMTRRACSTWGRLFRLAMYARRPASPREGAAARRSRDGVRAHRTSRTPSRRASHVLGHADRAALEQLTAFGPTALHACLRTERGTVFAHADAMRSRSSPDSRAPSTRRLPSLRSAKSRCSVTPIALHSSSSRRSGAPIAIHGCFDEHVVFVRTIAQRLHLLRRSDARNASPTCCPSARTRQSR